MSPARDRGDSEAARTTQDSGHLERGRRSYSTRAWLDAYESFSRADQTASLGAEDLELLATSAYMLGRDDEWMRAGASPSALRRRGETQCAARCALWLGINLALGGEIGRATGWLGRAQRLLDRDGRDCAERGYLLLPVMFQHEATGDFAAAAATAAEAAEIGRALRRRGPVRARGSRAGLHVDQAVAQVKQGLGLLDEAMVAVTTGELSPISTGLVYCGVILGCQEVYEVRRAGEWTAALTRWCEEQPDVVAFTGRCLVHRAEIMQLRGAWGGRSAEARRAGVVSRRR